MDDKDVIIDMIREDIKEVKVDVKKLLNTEAKYQGAWVVITVFISTITSIVASFIGKK